MDRNERIKNNLMCSKDEQKCNEGEKMKTDFSFLGELSL